MAEPTPLLLLIATGNAGKAREFRQMLGADRFAWSDLSSFPNAPDVEETGNTFRANACLKASTYAKHFQLWTLADDSGLEVDALDGAPGVLSARWAAVNNAGKGDADNNALLLRQLADVPDERRTARFVCVLALARPDGRVILTARDTVEGRIIHAPAAVEFQPSQPRQTPQERHALPGHVRHVKPQVLDFTGLRSGHEQADHFVGVSRAVQLQLARMKLPHHLQLEAELPSGIVHMLINGNDARDSSGTNRQEHHDSNPPLPLHPRAYRVMCAGGSKKTIQQQIMYTCPHT